MENEKDNLTEAGFKTEEEQEQARECSYLVIIGGLTLCIAIIIYLLV